jgi:UDP-2,3-diacylglucosamine pyrophosphatase LpxH
MSLQTLWDDAPIRPLTDSDKVAILSDWHMGDGGPNDDFKKNANLMLEALENYYEPRGWTLVLNGDIEEYLRARPEAIRKAWAPVFTVLDRLRTAGRLIRLVGNHEIRDGLDDFLAVHRPFDGEAVKFDYGGRILFLFHGHQGGTVNSGRFNRFIGWSLRAFANTLRIGNPSIANDNDKKIRLEKKVYEFSRSQGALSIIGHTHRPLFESLSRQEASSYHLERLCRRWAKATGDRRQTIREAVDRYRARGPEKPGDLHLTDLVYGDVVVPCLFNSGCAVGKRGFTTLEIKRGKMALTFWSDAERSRRLKGEYKPSTILPRGLRFVLRRERLDYLFSRIELLK